jgi:hypothetical protein
MATSMLIEFDLRTELSNRPEFRFSLYALKLFDEDALLAPSVVLTFHADALPQEIILRHS